MSLQRNNHDVKRVASAVVDERNKGKLHRDLPNLRMLDLRIVNLDEGIFGLEIPDESDGGGFAGIACISLECEPEDRDALLSINVSIGFENQEAK